METNSITYQEAVWKGAVALDNAKNISAFDLSFLLSCLFLEKTKEETLMDIIRARDAIALNPDAFKPIPK